MLGGIVVEGAGGDVRLHLRGPETAVERRLSALSRVRSVLEAEYPRELVREARDRIVEALLAQPQNRIEPQFGVVRRRAEELRRDAVVEEFAPRSNNRGEAEDLPLAGRGCDSTDHRRESTPAPHFHLCPVRLRRDNHN